MKVDISEEEAALIQFAIVHAEKLWRKEGNHYMLKDELAQRVLDKMRTILEEGE